MPLSMTGEFDSPYAPGSADDAEYRKALTRGVPLALTQAVPTWVGMLSPRATDEDDKTHWALPGLMTAGYGGMGSAVPDIANWAVRKATGYNLNIPHAPGADAALKSAAGNERWADSVVPHMEAQSPDEQGLVDVARGAASFSVPGLGSAGAISKLPRAAQIATHIALPGLGVSGKGAVAGGVMAGGAGTLEEYQNQQLLKELDAKTTTPQASAQAPAQTQAPGASPFDAPMMPTPTDLSQPDTSHTVATPAMGARVTLPFSTTSSQAQATPSQVQATANQTSDPNSGKYDTLAAFGRPDLKVLTPDFGAEGERGLTFGEAALGTLAAGTAAVIAMRHGGKVLDPLIKTITGEGDQINTVARRMESNRRLDAIDNAGAGISATDPNKPGAARGEAPLPGKAGTVGTKLGQNLYDQNRVLTEFSNATAPNSGAAKQMEARIATTNNSTPLMNQVTEQMSTGVNLANGGSIVPKWKTVLQDYAGLKPDQVTRVERGLYAGDELDTRKIKFNNAVKAGTSLADEDLRHNYRGTHSDELRTAYADMMRDPETAAIAKQIYAVQRANMFEARDMGRITSNDMRRIVDTRPRQIPSTNSEGVVEHALGARDIDTIGWDTPPTRAIDAVTQHYGKLYAELQRNNLLHDILSSAEQYQKSDPTAARVVTRLLDKNGKPITPPSGPAVGRRITTYREGVPHTWEIDNTDLYRAMKGNMAKTGLILDTADTLRRLYQGGTTGVMATALSQRPFAFINLNRNIMQIGTDRAPGTSFGMLDKGVNKLSGGRFGFRNGVDPTQWIGSYGEALKGVGAVTAHSMSNSLRNPNNIATKTLRATLGDNFVDGWAHLAEQRWAKTNAAQRKAEGVSGIGGGGTYERPTYNVSSTDRSGYSGLHNAVQGVFHPNDVHLPFTKVAIPGTKGAVSSYIDMRSWLREVHQEISEGANSYYWKNMRDDPKITREQRVYNTRQVVGDPSVRGAGKGAEWATHYIPWVNPSIQDAVRMMRNLRDNPVSFTLGTMTRLGVAAAASLASAMLGGNRHINMLGHLMSTHDRASNVTFFHDPSDEHNYTQISMPQRDRVLYPGILEGIANGSGAFQLHQDEDMYHRVLHSVLDMFSHHIAQSTATASREGLADFAGIFQAPPPVQALAAIGGKQFNEPLGQAMKNYAEGQPLLHDMMGDANGVPKTGQAGGGYVSNNDANWFRNVMKSVLGLSGDAYLKAVHGVERYNLSHDIANAFGGVLSDAGQSWRDQAPFGNMIWGNNVKMATRNPLEEVNRTAYDKMRAMPPATAVQNTGLTRPGGVLLNAKDHAPVNSDPRIVRMVSIVNNYKQQIDTTVQPQIGDINKQIRDVDEDPHFDPQNKRLIRNDLVTKKNTLESKKNLLIEQMHASMSMIAGKPVSVLTFDPAKGMEQFPD